jgi:protein-S-isoprenylcysteine O-methyltransferase Ste14
MTDNPDQAMSAYQRTRRHVIAALLVLICVALVFVGSSQSDAAHEWIEMAGIVLIVAGIGGRLWSTLYIGGRKSAEVVDTGPYSIMRNPLYFFSMIAAAGAGAQVGSVTLAVVFAFLCWLAFTIVIRREEAYLSTKMGAGYADYLARVPRFFPNPSLYRDQKEVTFRPKLLRQTLLDGLLFFASIPLFEFIEIAQNDGSIPVFLRLY